MFAVRLGTYYYDMKNVYLNVNTIYANRNYLYWGTKQKVEFCENTCT
jgi:hypothetical protein